MKSKFNLKLTAFMVSLFISLLLVIVGSKNKYCLSFGFVLMGVALIFLACYMREKISNELKMVNEQIDEIDLDEEIELENKVYIEQQLYVRQKQLAKKHKSSLILFSISAFCLILLGLIGLF